MGIYSPDNHVVTLTVDFQGETYSGACSDYVDVSIDFLYILHLFTLLEGCYGHLIP